MRGSAIAAGARKVSAKPMNIGATTDITSLAERGELI